MKSFDGFPEKSVKIKKKGVSGELKAEMVICTPKKSLG